MKHIKYTIPIVVITVILILTSATAVYAASKSHHRSDRVSTKAAVTAETTTKATTEATTETTTITTTEPPTEATTADSRPDTIKDFYKESIFAGDSLIAAFKGYVSSGNCPFLDESNIYGTVSFSAIHALKPISENSLNLVSDGEKILIEDLCARKNAKSLYLLLGANDVGITGVDETVQNFKTLIERIQAKNPDIVCNILSIGYIVKNSEKGNLNNENIRAVNALLEEYCNSAENLNYIEISQPLTTEDGYLSPEYSSDGYLHLNYAAYDEWKKVLINFAAPSVKNPNTYK